MENIKQQANSMDPQEVLKQSVKAHKEKIQYVVENKRVLEDLAQRTQLERATIQKAQKYLHTKGCGWGDGCLDFAKDAKEKDIISAKFSSLCELITVLVKVGAGDELKPYIQAMKDRGIEVDISSIMCTDAPEGDVASDVAKTLDSSAVYMGKIKEHNEILKYFAEEAERSTLCPKNRFNLLRLATAKEDGMDIQEKISDELFKMALYESGLEKLNESQL